MCGLGDKTAAIIIGINSSQIDGSNENCAMINLDNKKSAVKLTP